MHDHLLHADRGERRRLHRDGEETIFSGINSCSVFCFVPSTEQDSLACGTAASVSETTYIGVTLRIPNPSGPANLTVSDGASLRNATLVN